MSTSAIAIVSGGMDSVTLLHYLVKKLNLRPTVLTYIYGQKHTREIEAARYQTDLLGCTDHQVMDLSILTPAFASSSLVSRERAIPHIEEVQGDPQPATYVPNRNMIFLSIAAAFAETRGASAIYYGAQAHDLYGYWDTTPDFLERINQLLTLNRKNAIQIHAPLVHMPKADVLRLGLDLGVDYAHTWSCYEGHALACGRCPTCAERLNAFKEVGLKDPLEYA
jgi:7-cyano-7-deazaguanine synthase